MSGDDRLNLFHLNDSSQLPQTFAETIALIEQAVMQRFAAETVNKGLYYHNETHIRNVQRRSQLIFDAIAPALVEEAQPYPIDLSRMRLLLDLCAIAHDMVQFFEPCMQDHMTRQRKAGVSEIATIDQLMQYIHQLNGAIDRQFPDRAAKFNSRDIAALREAITATICAYDPQEQAIYQPLLYDPDQYPSIITRILALADLGALGIDGIAVFNQEGSLLFLEENPDVIPLLQTGTIHRLQSNDPALSENIRQRLLKRCRFQVRFAQSRLARFEPELSGFPAAAIPVLKEQTFQHMTPMIVAQVAATTPTADNTSLETLLAFFQFEQYLDQSAVEQVR